MPLFCIPCRVLSKSAGTWIITPGPNISSKQPMAFLCVWHCFWRFSIRQKRENFFKKLRKKSREGMALPLPFLKEGKLKEQNGQEDKKGRRKKRKQDNRKKVWRKNWKSRNGKGWR